MDRLAYEENAGPGHRDKYGAKQDRYDPTRIIIDPIQHGRPRLCQRRFDGSCSRFNYADLPPCTVSFCTQDAPQRRAPNNSPRASRRPLSMRAYVEGAPMTRVTASRAPARWRRFPHNQGPDGISSLYIRRKAPRYVPTAHPWSSRQPEPFPLCYTRHGRQARRGYPLRPKRRCRGLRNEAVLCTLERVRLNALRPE